MERITEKLFGLPTMQFCEKVGEGFIKRPFYAISDLSYLAIGILILHKGKGSALSKTFGCTAVAIGSFSMIYDITNTYLSQLFDLAAMLVFVNILLFMNIKEPINIQKHKVLFLASSLVSSLLLIFVFGGFSGAFLFGTFVLLVILSGFILLKNKIHSDPRDWYIGLTLFVVGFAFWIPDGARLYCSPSGIINGRSVFHLMTALTIYFLYNFYQKQEKT